jgi:hypothetical protein
MPSCESRQKNTFWSVLCLTDSSADPDQAFYVNADPEESQKIEFLHQN